jgi:hypothetical protein
MSTQDVLREVENGHGAGTIRRKPLPNQDSFDSSISRRIVDLSLSTTVESRPGFLVSPTNTTFSATSGDEFLGFPSETEPSEPTSDKSSKFKTAFQEARHFAGGLISHPHESTKHYSILRHSHGIVYFKGFSTNIAISVFADRELPDDRQFWLQKKGFSGKTGLKIGASMGSKSGWINVTPAISATADQLAPADERAWQRDIEKFLRKAPKEVRYHVPRETCIIRIPSNVQDGYFRVVMCRGEKDKKVLCPSPIFRLASTSTSISSVRGASLSTLPLELSIKIGQIAARTAALNGLAPVVSAATSGVKQLIPYKPSSIVQYAASAAYDESASEVSKKLELANEQYQQSQELAAEQLLVEEQEEFARQEMIGDDDGPEAPFPIRFASKVIPGTGKSRATFGIPTANLNSIPEEIFHRFSGTYMGWASIAPNEKLEMPSDVLSCWHQAIITIAPVSDARATVVPEKTGHVYLLAEFGDLSFISATISLIIMGPLRSHQSEPLDIESRLFAITEDIRTTQLSLDRPAWSADNTLTRIQTDKSNRSMKEKLVDVKNAGFKQVDRLQLHKAGIRTKGMGVRDRLVGRGGVCVKR